MMTGGYQGFLCKGELKAKREATQTEEEDIRRDATVGRLPDNSYR
jgi:hypothetical protein